MSNGLWGVNSMSQVVHTLWIGEKLGPIYNSCIRSIVRQGHDVFLHSYAPPLDMPAGVRFVDASKIMKFDEIEKYKASKILALASDVYRYRLQREGMGLYVDCDIFFFKEIKEEEYILGWETVDVVNNAVLKVPKDSNILHEILEASENPFYIPPWLSVKRQRELLLRKFSGFPKPLSKHAWGTIGPSLITYLVKKIGLEDKVAPIDVFYPLYYKHTPLLVREGVGLKDLITRNTVGIHLTNSVLRLGDPKRGTALYEILNS
ncbi:hypothetical protein QBK99_09005 [Corticibacterium sp. UT-5YL-CI-8]|nr:hypothetical protein [Tianweitania sp. UT-5YL-CI-8]